MALLAGKTAVITGGSSGIGLATARRFVEEGAAVFIFSRRPAELDAAVATLGTAATGIHGDVTGSADLQKLRAIVAATGNGVDAIFANTGIAGAAPLGEITHKHFDSLFGINVKGVVLTIQMLLPLRVNTVNLASTDAPGPNELVDNAVAESMEQLKTPRGQEIPFGRLAQADEVANAVVFLASDLSSFTTGTALPVDLGYSQI